MSLLTDLINLDLSDSTEKIIAEYIWIGGSGMDLRSKARTLPGPVSDPHKLPKWNYDGSSTGQAPGEDSEVILYPQAIFKDPFRRGNNILVMCDTYTPAGEPIPTNKRYNAAKIFSHPAVVAEVPWYGIEQEYTLLQKDVKWPIGWPVGGYPGPQGPYYCAAGADKAFGRDIVDAHYKACLYAGINISGINGEVMPGQWEFQVGPSVGISAGDELWVARYILFDQNLPPVFNSPFEPMFPASRSVSRTASTLTRLSQLQSHTRTSRLASITSPRKMSSVPSTMKTVLVEKNGGTEVLQYTTDHQVPQVKDSQVLIKNKFGGINYIDTYFRTGLYPAPKWPLILGQEGVGTIAAIGSSNPYNLKVGDNVVYMTQGSYAEYTAVPAEKVVKVPSGLSDEVVLGSFLMGMTALSLVKESYEVKKGDTILVHAAAGGVGLLMCQILKDIGATVIGTASTKEKCDRAKAAGATHMINYKDISDWVSEVRKIAPDGVDCVYDSVGKTTWEGSLNAVRRKGSVIYFGNASGPVPPLNIALLAKNNTKIMRATVMQYLVTRDELDYYTGLLFDYLKSGKLQVEIHKIYDLKDVKQAHEDLEGRLTSGKLLLKTA